MKIIDFKDASCRHCYKCVRNCNVKAISVKNHQAHIMEYHCIHCGHCLEVCPQNAKTFVSDLERIRAYIRQGTKVVVSLAPSFAGVLEYVKPGQVVDALKKLGFYRVRETAEGAARVTEEYVCLMEAGQMDNIITTCCPAINDLVEKYYPQLVDQMAPVVSPMIAHGRMLREIYGPEVKIVFLGPCIAKKAEAFNDERVEGVIDGVLTFEQLKLWLEEYNMDLTSCEDVPVDNPDPWVNRHYPISGGIIKAVMDGQAPESHYHKVFVDGLGSCMELLDSMLRGEIHGCFLELNVCEGGCIKGPVSGKTEESFVKSRLRLQREVRHIQASEQEPAIRIAMDKTFSNCSVKDITPDEEQMEELLRSMGKYTRSDELNCGACGYGTCRDKAVAVYQGKAEVDMCLPYALAKAESMANVVMDTTPDLIFIVDRQLHILECNKMVQRVFGMSHEEIVSDYIFELMDDDTASEVFDQGINIYNRKVQMPSHELKLSQTVVYIEERDCVLSIYKDISREEQLKEQHLQMKMDTIDMAQEVIDKQMRVAQEIAGLLGETTAETKITLTKLRDSLLSEEEE